MVPCVVDGACRMREDGGTKHSMVTCAVDGACRVREDGGTGAQHVLQTDTSRAVRSCVRAHPRASPAGALSVDGGGTRVGTASLPLTSAGGRYRMCWCAASQACSLADFAGACARRPCSVWGPVADGTHCAGTCAVRGPIRASRLSVGLHGIVARHRASESQGVSSRAAQSRAERVKPNLTEPNKAGPSRASRVEPSRAEPARGSARLRELTSNRDPVGGVAPLRLARTALASQRELALARVGRQGSVASSPLWCQWA